MIRPICCHTQEQLYHIEARGITQLSMKPRASPSPCPFGRKKIGSTLATQERRAFLRDESRGYDANRAFARRRPHAGNVSCTLFKFAKDCCPSSPRLPLRRKDKTVQQRTNTSSHAPDNLSTDTLLAEERAERKGGYVLHVLWPYVTERLTLALRVVTMPDH